MQISNILQVFLYLTYMQRSQLGRDLHISSICQLFSLNFLMNFIYLGAELFDRLSEWHYKKGHSFRTWDTNCTQIVVSTVQGPQTAVNRFQTGFHSLVMGISPLLPVPCATFAFPTKPRDNQRENEWDFKASQLCNLCFEPKKRKPPERFVDVSVMDV